MSLAILIGLWLVVNVAIFRTRQDRTILRRKPSEDEQRAHFAKVVSIRSQQS